MTKMKENMDEKKKKMAEVKGIMKHIMASKPEQGKKNMGKQELVEITGFYFFPLVSKNPPHPHFSFLGLSLPRLDYLLPRKICCQ